MYVLATWHVEAAGPPPAYDSRVSTRVEVCPQCGRKNRVPAAAAGTPQCGACHTSLPWLTDADDLTYPDIVERARIPVLVDLWAPWCGPCRQVSPAVERVGRKYAGRLKVTKVNVDIAQQVAARYNATSIPTLLVLRNGQVVDRLVGAVPQHQLDSWVRTALG